MQEIQEIQQILTQLTPITLRLHDVLDLQLVPRDIQISYHLQHGKNLQVQLKMQILDTMLGKACIPEKTHHRVAGVVVVAKTMIIQLSTMHHPTVAVIHPVVKQDMNRVHQNPRHGNMHREKRRAREDLNHLDLHQEKEGSILLLIWEMKRQLQALTVELNTLACLNHFLLHPLHPEPKLQPLEDPI